MKAYSEYTYEHIYICTYMYIYICLYIHAFIHLFICMHTHMYIYIYIYVCTLQLVLTPWHFAASNGHSEALQMLIEAGADIIAFNKPVRDL